MTAFNLSNFCPLRPGRPRFPDNAYFYPRIDDETTNLINQMLLEDLGLTQELLVARNGKEALELVQQRHQSKNNCSDLILLDINMPVMDGFEFLEAFEQLDVEEKSSVVIVMLPRP